MTKNLLSVDHNELDGLRVEVFGAFEKEDVAEVFKKLDLFWARLAMHIRAEHLHLFPAILDAFKNSSGAAVSLETARRLIETLREDHNFFMRQFGAAVKQMRELSENNSAVERANILTATRLKLEAVARRLEEHNQTEETQIYQWIETILDESERAALDEQMQKELNNLPPRLADDFSQGEISD